MFKVYEGDGEVLNWIIFGLFGCVFVEGMIEGEFFVDV